MLYVITHRPPKKQENFFLCPADLELLRSACFSLNVKTNCFNLLGHFFFLILLTKIKWNLLFNSSHQQFHLKRDKFGGRKITPHVMMMMMMMIQNPLHPNEFNLERKIENRPPPALLLPLMSCLSPFNPPFQGIL